MSNEGSLINLGDISKPAIVLIEKISDAIGGIFRPYQIRRVAQAEADAEKIRKVARIKVTELQRRALYRFIHEEAKKQNNIENITRKALPDVAEKAQPQDIEDDWITNFFDKCRLISDEEMQQLWAKVLSGEANSPGKYSKRTVTLLSSLDKVDAQLFSTLCSFGWVMGEMVPLIYNIEDEIYSKAGLTFVGLKHLDDIGLIRFESLTEFRSTKLSQRGLVLYFDSPVIIEFQKPEQNDLNLGHVLLSKAGQELAPICGSKPCDGFRDYVIKKWTEFGYKVPLANAEQIAGANKIPPHG